VTPAASPQATANAVLAVLAGTPLHEAASQVSMEPADLDDAIELYQSAGQAALQAQARTRDWHQVRIEFPTWDTAEQAAAAFLGPQLQHAETTGTIASWWFIRKAPCWRLRCQLGQAPQADMTALINRVLSAMLAQGLIIRSQETIYEPETCAFGGPGATGIAHRLFHADSRNILRYLNNHNPAAPPASAIGRRELSILLCSTLMRSAGQDWYEQGDIWDRVMHNRPLQPGTPLERLHDLKPSLRQLMTVDAGPGSKLISDGGALAFTSGWASSFAFAGTALHAMAQHGNLNRGLRDVLAHHVIFHWNRIGLNFKTQSILATAARDVVFGG
jgi:thiopeptide-type bacteriocin biosynthesis protein